MHRMPLLATVLWTATFADPLAATRPAHDDDEDDACDDASPGDIEETLDVADEIFACEDDCDRYIDDPDAHPALRRYLAFARAPAHGQLLPRPHPRLFADYEGQRVRVTMASRFGDVGITTDLSAELGYDRRVLVRQLGNFSEDP